MRDCDDGAELDCETRADEDDAQSDTEQLHSTTSNKRQKLHSSHQVSPANNASASIARDPAAIARQAKAMARNRASLFGGDISRVKNRGFEELARLSEYSRGVSAGSALARLTGESHRNPDDFASLPQY